MRQSPERHPRFVRAKRIAPYFSWSLFAAGLMFCLGSLQSFASGLNHVSREMQIDTAPQASLVYDRNNRRFPKRQILEAYLNRIYLGDGHYGVEAAARGYFGKTAADLTAPEAALLAGLIKCPSACSPRIAPAAAKARRDTVLGEMREVGNLTNEEYAQAVAAPIALTPARHDPYDPGHIAMAAGEEGEAGQPCSLYFVEAV